MILEHARNMELSYPHQSDVSVFEEKLYMKKKLVSLKIICGKVSFKGLYGSQRKGYTLVYNRCDCSALP